MLETLHQQLAFLPSVSLGRSILRDCLNKDSQFLQAGICAHPHSDNAETQAIVTCSIIKK